MDERSTAIHEAGHAVAACVLRLEFSSVRIFRNDVERWVAYAPEGTMGGVADLTGEIGRHVIVAILAGREALLDAGGPDDGWSIDYERAIRRLGALNGDNITNMVMELERLRRRARKLVQWHRSAVTAVADALLARRYLESHDVRRIVKGVTA